MSPIYFFLLPSLPRRPGSTLKDKLQGFDWLGTVLTAALYVCFAMAFSFGGAIWAWNDGRVITLIVLWIVFTIAFSITQYYSLLTNPLDRLFPLDFLRNPQLVLLYVCMACGGCALFVSIYYIPLYFLFVHGDTGTEAAVRLLPFMCFYVGTILTCGVFMARTGYHMVWYLISGVFLTCGGALMHSVRIDTPPSHIYGYAVLLGLGMATTQAGYAVGPLLVKPERVAEVIQFLNISQGQSQLIGLAVASSIFQSVTFDGLKQVLAGTGYSDSEIQAAIAGAQSAVLRDTNLDLRVRVYEVIVGSISDAWVLIIVAGGLYTVCSLFLTRKRFLS